MSVLQYRLVSCLEKCFSDTDIESLPLCNAAGALRGEVFSFQLAFCGDNPDVWTKQTTFVRVDSPLKPYISIASVENVPVRLPTYRDCDDGNYLRTQPGLFPDLLLPVGEDRQVYIVNGFTNAVWFDVAVPEDCPGGEYPITVSLVTETGETCLSDVFTLTVIPATLPKQKLIRTEWFHGDCLADYYQVPVFSEEHWTIMENFIRNAVKNGINMILTPIFTPPLDTAVGGERTTIQLVDVTCTNGTWSFGFDRLTRWVEMCRRCGVEYWEMAHLFTQWGCAHAPKIMATVDGEYRRVFGWETDALGEEYHAFLNAFLPALVARLHEYGIDGAHAFFHVSDEPSLKHLEQYRAARAMIEPHLHGFPIMDALSNFEFYQTGAISCPIPSNDHIEEFLEANVPNLWTYYCCGQAREVSNRFLAMPGARTRILGVQLYKYRIAGFLQWGFNFYNSQFSLQHIDPYFCTDGEFFVPAGDAFEVYPAPDGTPYETMHQRHVTAAMYDLRALELAESLCGRDAVMQAIEGDLPEAITFRKYPHDGAYLLSLREKIHALITQAL